MDEYEALTLNHFLLGQQSSSISIINNEKVHVMLGRKWRAATNMFGHN